MKKGLVTSVVVHAAVLGGMLVSFSSPVPLDATITEALPVSLVPVADEMSVRKGEKAVQKKEKPAPRPTVKPPVPQEGKNTGDNKDVDTVAPVNEKVKQERKVDAPPPSGKPDADITSEVKEVEKPVEPVEAAAEPAPPTEVQEQAKTEPEMKKTEPELKKAEPEMKKDTAPVLPDTASMPVPGKKPQPQKAAAPRGETLDKILARNEQALVDKTKTRGGGTKRSTGEEALGGREDIGAEDFQQTLDNIIGSCVRRNWRLAAIDSSTAYDLRVVAHFRLNRDGTLQDEPELTPAGGDEIQRSIITSQAQAALKLCTPFSLPADKYDRWRDVTVNMKAL